MNSDIRLKVTFPNHHKTKKLYRRLGAQGPLSLIYLWLYASENKPDGLLTGMDEEDIELASQWTGESGALVAAMLELCLLHKVACSEQCYYKIHDWKENNPYAFHAPLRAEKARKAAESRWGKTKQKPDDNAPSMPLADLSNAPAPDPTPTPKPVKTTASKPTRPPVGDQQSFIGWWLLAFSLIEDKPYYITEKEAKHVKTLLSKMGLKSLMAKAAKMLLSEDEFLQGKKDLGMLASQINKLDNLTAEETDRLREMELAPPKGETSTDWLPRRLCNAA